MANETHKIKVTIDRNGFAEVTLDGALIPNVTDIHVFARRHRASVEFTIEDVEVEVQGEMHRAKVVERTEHYESGD